MAALAKWEKDLRNAVKQQHSFGWSVRNKRGRVLVQRFWKDTGTYERKVLPIKWESGITLEVLSALRKINDAMTSGGINLKEATELVFIVEDQEAAPNWENLISNYKSEKEKSGVSESTWVSNYKVVTDRILKELNSESPPVSGKGILERLQNGHDGKLQFGEGRRRRIINATAFLKYCVSERGLDQRWSPPLDTKKIKGTKKRNDYKSANSGKAERLEDSAFLDLIDSFPDTATGKRWKLAIGLLGCFGLRGVELRYAAADGELLDIGYKKITAHGETEQRKVEGLSPIERPNLAKQLLLELALGGDNALPPLGKDDKSCSSNIDSYLSRRAFWKKLKSDAKQAEKKLSVYSFRHAFAYRGAVIYKIGIDDLSQNMGHSLSTHMKHYRNFHDESGRATRFETARKSVLLS